MEACEAIISLIEAFKKFKHIPKIPDDSLRSQYYSKYRVLINQCLDSACLNVNTYSNCNDGYERLETTLVKLKYLMDAKLRLTALEDNQKKQMIHKMFQDDEKIKRKIFDLRKDIENCQNRFDDLVKQKLELIEKRRKEIDELNERCGSHLNSEIYHSETTMKKMCTKHDEEAKGITASLEEAEERLKLLLCENLHKEQELRKEKLNSQIQLKKWLDKYDDEIGSRTTTIRELNGIYEKEQLFLEKLEETCRNQETQYTALMLQKEREEKELLEEKMLLFMMNRAARIIQHHWRLVMAKKRLKKGRRGKGKKSS